jgi:hypothetical protein
MAARGTGKGREEKRERRERINDIGTRGMSGVTITVYLESAPIHALNVSINTLYVYTVEGASVLNTPV